jgi:uncharacterized RDD family membrane protein YckC
MKRIVLVRLALAGGLAGPAVLPAAAQDFIQIERVRWGHVTNIRVAQDYVLREEDRAHDVIVVWGKATIEGHVYGDVTVAFGSLDLGPRAVIDGSLAVIGGRAKVQPGAVVQQTVAVVGGGLEAPPEFLPGRDHFVIGTADLFDQLKVAVPWLTQGLLMGRPIAPRVQWVWEVVAIVFAVSLLLCLIFLNGVRQCANVLATRPLSTFLIGLLVLLLTGPLAVILAASVIGIAVLPFLFCALIIAWTIGKVGVAMWVGSGVTGQNVPEARLPSVLAFVLGFVAICFAYAVPVLGLIAWGLVGVMGLGASTVAFTAAYRRENPKVRKNGATLPPPPPPTAPAPHPAPVVDPVASYTPPPIADDPALPPASFSNVSAPPAGAQSPLVAFPRAAFVNRLAAFALDVALVVILRGALDIGDPDDVIWFLLGYHVLFWTWKGTTVGGIICQVRVVRIDGQPVKLPDAIVRALASVLSIAAFGIGCFWILRDPERQAWHDKIAGTYVVKVPRGYAVA